MNWLRKMSWRPKHPRDQKRIFLYHLSDRCLTNLRGKSRLGSKYVPVRTGLYFSPSFRSLINDWMPYIVGKKRRTHDIEKRFRELNIELDKLHPEWFEFDNKDYDLNKVDPQVLQRYREIETEKARLQETLNRDTHRERSNQRYKTLFLTKISAPKAILNESRAFMQKVFDDQDKRGVAEFGFWGWGEQIFIPEEYFPEIEIVFSKPYTPEQLWGIGNDTRKPRGYSDPAWRRT